jgi:hypothetical protein
VDLSGRNPESFLKKYSQPPGIRGERRKNESKKEKI